MKPELLRSISDLGFEHPSEDMFSKIARFVHILKLLPFSPKGMHPSSCARDGCALPSQVLSRKDCRLHPYHLPAIGAGEWQSVCPRPLPYPGVSIPDQERIRSFRQVPPRGSSWDLLWWHSGCGGCRTSVRQVKMPTLLLLRLDGSTPSREIKSWMPNKHFVLDKCDKILEQLG